MVNSMDLPKETKCSKNRVAQQYHYCVYSERNDQCTEDITILPSSLQHVLHSQRGNQAKFLLAGKCMQKNIIKLLKESSPVSS